MSDAKSWSAAAAKNKLREAMDALTALGFAPKQSNEAAAYTLLALLDLHPNTPWDTASQPLRGITPIIEFVAKAYRRRFKPNTRETIRDEAVKYFVESGMVLRNPDNPGRPTNSGNTVYQIEPAALSLFRAYGTLEWSIHLKAYQKARAGIRHQVVQLVGRVAQPVDVLEILTFLAAAILGALQQRLHMPRESRDLPVRFFCCTKRCHPRIHKSPMPKPTLY